MDKSDWVNIESQIPIEWLPQIDALCAAMKMTRSDWITRTIELALAQAISRTTAELTDEDIEDEPDEILYDFLESEDEGKAEGMDGWTDG